MSELERLAAQLRKLTHEADVIIDDVRAVARRTAALERDVGAVRTSGVDARRLAGLLRMAAEETGSAIAAIDTLRLEGKRFADSLATGGADRGSAIRSVIGDALIAAEAAHLFLAPTVVPLVPTASSERHEPVAAQLIELSSEQLENADDLNDLKEALDTPQRVVDRRRSMRNRDS